jgi:hypothetical protein
VSETETSFAVRDTAEPSKNRASILQQFRAARKALLDDKPEPTRRKEKEKTDRSLFPRTAAILIRRIARRAERIVKLTPGACGPAAHAQTARFTEVLPDEDGAAAPYEALDAANPYWDFSLDSDAGVDFSADRGGPSPGF